MDFNCGLKAYKATDLVKNIECMEKCTATFPAIAKWARVSPRLERNVVQHQERKYGTTKFGLEPIIVNAIFGFIVHHFHR